MAGSAGPANVIAAGGELAGPAELRDIYAGQDHRAGNDGPGRYAHVDRGPSRRGPVRPYHPQRLTLAWVLALAPTVIPIPGASRPESVTDSARAADLTLTSEEVARLSKSW